MRSLGVPPRRRLAGRHRRLLQLAFDRFQADAAWPQVARLQHELARQGDPFTVRDVAKDLDPWLGHVDRVATGAEIKLTIGGVRRCVGAEQEVHDFVQVVGYFVRRYLDAPAPPAEVTSAELQHDLDLSDMAARKMRLLLSSSNVPTAGGGGTEDNWRWLIDDQILPFRSAETIDQVIRRAYPPGRPRNTTARFPGSASAAQFTSPAGVSGTAVAAARASDIVDWPAPAPGWGSVEARLSSLHSKLTDAATRDDWQDIGRRCREIVIEAANVVFTPRLVPVGSKVPGTNDAKARLDAYFETRLPGLADDMRAFVAGTWRLANALTHHPRMGRLEAVSSAQGVILLVRVHSHSRRLSARRGGVAVHRKGHTEPREDPATGLRRVPRSTHLSVDWRHVCLRSRPGRGASHCFPAGAMCGGWPTMSASCGVCPSPPGSGVREAFEPNGAGASCG